VKNTGKTEGEKKMDVMIKDEIVRSVLSAKESAKEKIDYNTFADYKKIVAGKRKSYLFAKRLFDIVFGIIGCVFLLIISIPISLLIILEDGIPVIFTQERNGLNGKVFKMYKFRSMCKDAPEMHKDLLKDNELDGPAFKMKEDPRVTKIGRFIRKTSIDELPQFINIVKGEMSFVGPRPLPTYETEQCNEYQNQRLLVKPGLTCYWQCMGRNNIEFDEWMELDLRYIREASVWTDLKIMFMTFGAVVKNEGAC